MPGSTFSLCERHLAQALGFEWPGPACPWARLTSWPYAFCRMQCSLRAQITHKAPSVSADSCGSRSGSATAPGVRARREVSTPRIWGRKAAQVLDGQRSARTAGPLVALGDLSAYVAGGCSAGWGPAMQVLPGRVEDAASAHPASLVASCTTATTAIGAKIDFRHSKSSPRGHRDPSSTSMQLLTCAKPHSAPIGAKASPSLRSSSPRLPQRPTTAQRRAVVARIIGAGPLTEVPEYCQRPRAGPDRGPHSHV